MFQQRGQEGTARNVRISFFFFFSPSSMTMNLLYAGSAAAGRARALSEKPDLRWTWREVEPGRKGRSVSASGEDRLHRFFK